MNSSSEKSPDWHRHFQIQSDVDLDFVIGQRAGWPVGMQRRSPAEFRRRVLAAAQSYVMRLKSIDYTLKQYIEPDQYDTDPLLLGDRVSDYLKQSAASIKEGLENLHTPEPEYGRFGAELTLYKFPEMLDTARMLANRGLFLEVLPILRLCLEMTAWAVAVFHSDDEKFVSKLKAQSCLAILGKVHPSAGRMYGYLSEFTHWKKEIHSIFVHIEPERVGVIRSSTKYRATSAALCLVLLDIFIEAIRYLYGQDAKPLVFQVRGPSCFDGSDNIHQLVHEIGELTEIDEIEFFQSLLS